MSKFDPLEEAKVSAEKPKEKKNKLFGKKKKTEAALPPPPPAPEEKSERADTADETPAAKSEPAFDASKKYRVLEDKICSVNGRVTTVRKGKILEARFYGGPLALQRLLETGIKVEAC